MRTSRILRAVSLLATTATLVATATPALAHPELGASFSMASGALHPLQGWDHLLAMVAVGLWAVEIGGRARFVLPATFVGAMIAGGIIAHLGLTAGLAASVETLIASTVVALGAALALKARPGAALGSAIVVVAGLAHGHAHGAEMPAAASLVGYLAGMAASTAALHASGIVAGSALARWPLAARSLGALIASAGVALAVT